MNDRKLSLIENGVLNSTEYDICFLIGGYLHHEKLESTLMDQSWMLDKLEAWFLHKISRSTLCYNLKNLVATGWLYRITRHRRNPDTGKFEPRVTCYKMTMKLQSFFLRIASRMRNIGWLNHITAAKKRVREATRAAIIAAREAALPANIEHIGSQFLSALGNFNPSSDTKIDDIYCMAYRFLCEFDFMIGAGLSLDLDLSSTKNFIMNDLEGLDERNRSQIIYASYMMPVNIAKQSCRQEGFICNHAVC